MDKTKRVHSEEAACCPPAPPTRGKPWSRKTRGKKEAEYYEFCALKLLLVDQDLCRKLINDRYEDSWGEMARGVFHNAAVQLLRKHETALGLCATIRHVVRIRRALLCLNHEHNRRIDVNPTGDK